MKKLAVLAVLVLIAFSFSACGKSKSSSQILRDEGGSVEYVNSLVASDGYRIMALYFIDRATISDMENTRGLEKGKLVSIFAPSKWLCIAERDGETYFLIIESGYFPGIIHVKKLSTVQIGQNPSMEEIRKDVESDKGP